MFYAADFSANPNTMAVTISPAVLQGWFGRVTSPKLQKEHFFFLHFSQTLFNHAESFPCNCQCFCPHTNIMGVNSICGAHGCEKLHLNKFKCNIYSSKNVKSLHTHTHTGVHMLPKVERSRNWKCWLPLNLQQRLQNFFYFDEYGFPHFGFSHPPSQGEMQPSCNLNVILRNKSWSKMSLDSLVTAVTLHVLIMGPFHSAFVGLSWQEEHRWN